MENNLPYEVKPSEEGKKREVVRGIVKGVAGLALAAGIGLLIKESVNGVPPLQHAIDFAVGFKDAIPPFATLTTATLGNIGLGFLGTISAAYGVITPFISYNRAQEVAEVTEDGKLKIERPIPNGTRVQEFELDSVESIKVRGVKKLKDGTQIGDIYIKGSILSELSGGSNDYGIPNRHRSKRKFQIAGVENPYEVRKELAERLLTHSASELENTVQE